MIAIIDSGGANIKSVQFALERLNVDAVFTKDANIIQSADKVILPGVGAAAHSMKHLEKNNLVEVIRGLTQPVLGICLGMQLLFSSSEEGGDVEMLKIFDEDVKKFTPAPNKTIPHMGWNNVKKMMDHPLTHRVSDDTYFYFVHSFRAPKFEQTVGSCDYEGEVFTAIVARDNFMGCQFHPERSGKEGQKILENFLAM